ncbi:hypothetical protein FZW96_21220 [Bacillus sp. BGMRC 2118]|nr:hypothetical protein FZW96_21220 [Bacillus sp. BGMRC 2118]
MNKQKLIDNIHYWDAKVLDLDIKHFADEIDLKCEAGELYFLECYELEVKHTPKFNKEIPARQWEYKNLPYTIHEIKVVEDYSSNVTKLNVEIIMPPMFIKLTCNDIRVNKYGGK